MNWDLLDFVVAGGLLLFIVGGSTAIWTRRSWSLPVKTAGQMGLAALIASIWVLGAVGFD